ncbi:threonine/serine exporter family protein [Aspergillus luchuensis]|uniref:DUF1212 domain membrane protein n=1 Tax=Aspergillus kawachii TaxID=1069201 RepID=A0A146FIB5_ASPKA|nr:uncharacterized protein AKAW2_40881S [Aspergillus luchuensis]BCR99198.1 hypothetical protein AKAW2_40881S [Aspergillus luchuensis]BCS11505.1 hypothetical protein ALUC_40845S [Aspergillus luchuensis]GAA87096.1 DUF1212 domain membrane protein [Aspergillus luchuensis IFO 4308]GAT25222.1 DUF1212 domain membrane protein [Aspergillus luchuensis]
MSEGRRSNDSSSSSLISYHSVERPNADFDVEKRHDLTPESDSSPSGPRTHRVHFGADRRFEYGIWDADERVLSPGTSHLRRRSSTQASVDITDVSHRGPQSTSTNGREEENEKKQQQTTTSEKRPRRERLKAFRDSIKEKAVNFAARLGRPDDINEDDLQPIDHRRRDTEPDLHSREEGQDQTCSTEAHRIIRELAHEASGRRSSARRESALHRAAGVSAHDEDSGNEAIPRRSSGSGGVLSQLLRLSGGWDQFHKGARGLHLASDTFYPFGGSTPGTTTPRKEKVRWYKKPGNVSTSTLVGGGSASGASTPVTGELLSAASRRRDKSRRHSMRLEEEIQVTLQIAEIIARQRYIMQLCKALMRFGAPTHRLEEYMRMTAKVLDVDSQFLYVPGCMIMSFDDQSTRTTEVKLVRVVQGVDLGRLADTHNVYKNVIHDMIGIEEAGNELEELMAKKPRFNRYFIVLIYGLATAMVGPFAFDARPIDMPIIFFNGCLLGCMQHILAPRSVLYSNVFEVTAAVLTSFLARAFGSIKSSSFTNGSNDYIFCFSAIAQSSIALILPGYTVLCSSLELQSQQIVAGSIRMVYAIIYSLFLGYGVTVGTTIYGLIDKNATSNLTCPTTGGFGNAYAQRFPFVAAFSLCLLIVNQGKWKQSPIMIAISVAGYVTNYFVSSRLGNNSQVANTVGAFTVGVMGNLYSRLWHGHAAAAILPAIFVLVPSGLAATGNLIAGVDTADEIRSNVTKNATGSSTTSSSSSSDMSTNILGFGMIQVAIGITVGLFVAALVVYPFGKRRSGLFSF